VVSAYRADSCSVFTKYFSTDWTTLRVFARRGALEGDVLRIRRGAVEAEDYGLSVGLDGLALAIRSEGLEPLAY
jgi:hypothetical protein